MNKCAIHAENFTISACNSGFIRFYSRWEMFRIYHIVESPLLTQLLVCFFFLEFVFFAMSFSLQSNSISSFSVFKIRFWRDDNFKVYVSEESAIFLVESKRHNFARMNENEDEKKNKCLWWRCIQRHLALILLLYFWSKGDILSQAPSHFPSRSFTLTAIICLNSRTNCSKANNLFKPLFSLYEIWSTDCFEFSVETIYAKK